jgi:carboxyl-terminal processing protease
LAVFLLEAFVNQSMRTIISVFVGIILLSGAFAGGVLVGHLVPSSNQLPFLGDLIPSAPTITPEEQAATPDELETLFAPFWEAWNIVHEEYVDQPVDDVELMRGAIRGMMDALGDKQTFYMDPIVYERQTSYLQGEYEGIGAYVDTAGEYLTIISPISGTPAEMAGLRSGDKIIAIDGEDMTGITPQEVHLKVLGPAGTTVNLTIQREGEPEPLEFNITRARIRIKSAEGKMLRDDIAYVDINTFGDNTTDEFRSTLNTLLQENPRGIIVDLRDNGGGYLHTSVEISSEFIDEGVVLYEQYGDGRRDVYDASGEGQATDLPIVVLVNEGSASASEILAGALQDYGRAKLVGVQSYGKGSVQNWIPLSNDQGAARVTIAKWLTPNERAIDGIGLTPDVYVECSECTLVETENDTQLQAAIDTLLAVINDSPIPTSMPTSLPTPVQ